MDRTFLSCHRLASMANCGDASFVPASVLYRVHGFVHKTKGDTLLLKIEEMLLVVNLALIPVHSSFILTEGIPLLIFGYLHKRETPFLETSFEDCYTLLSFAITATIVKPIGYGDIKLYDIIQAQYIK